MQTNLIIVNEDWKDSKVAELVDCYLACFSKERVRYIKTQRKVVVDSLGVSFQFRRMHHSIIPLVKGNAFFSVRLVECYADSRLMGELQLRTKNIKIDNKVKGVYFEQY